MAPSPKRKAPPSRPVDHALIVGAQAHFADPAYYDKTYRARSHDVRFYERIAAEHGGPVLEYGVGNGRIALPLARAGIKVHGVDWSRPMLDDLARRLEAEPPPVRRRLDVTHGDMREIALDKRFRLVLCTFNTFLHLYTRDDVERFLARVRAHLARGGLFVFDASLPHPLDLARDPSRAYGAPRLRHPTTGQLVRYRERFDYDHARQILFVTIEFHPERGEPWAVPLAHRQFFPRELEALLHYNGFTIDRFDGGFDQEPLDADSDSMVIVSRATR